MAKSLPRRHPALTASGLPDFGPPVKPTPNYAQRGRQRERQVAERLREEGWVTLKGTSYGVADLAAMRAGDTPLLIEVKSTTRGPYADFSPAEREVMVLEAERAGARAVLAYWPPRKQLRLIPSSEWPEAS